MTIQPTADSNDATVTFIGAPGPTAPTLSAFGTCASSGLVATYRAFHEYDLSGIPPGATILSATHNLYIAQYCTPDSQTMAAYRVLTPWSESTITWANQPAHDPTPYGARLAGNAATSPPGYNAWDVTALVQFWVDNPGSNRGLVMRAVDESVPIAAVAAVTGESGPATAPFLQITYTGGGSVLGDDQAVVVDPRRKRPTPATCASPSAGSMRTTTARRRSRSGTRSSSTSSRSRTTACWRSSSAARATSPRRE